jgi:hypothetical protein
MRSRLFAASISDCERCRSYKTNDNSKPYDSSENSTFLEEADRFPPVRHTDSEPAPERGRAIDLGLISSEWDGRKHYYYFMTPEQVSKAEKILKLLEIIPMVDNIIAVTDWPD